MIETLFPALHPDGELAWLGDPLWTSVAALVAVVGWLALVAAPRRSTELGPRVGEALLLAVGLGAVVAVLAKPSWVEASGRALPGRTAVLVDASSSLGVAEHGVLRSAEVSRRLEAVTGDRVEVFHFGGDLRTGPPPRYDLGQTDVGGALEALAERYVGERLEAVVLITDGIDGGNLRAEHRAGRAVVPPSLPGPLTVVGVGTPGALRDLAVVRADSGGFAYAHTPMVLTVEVRGEGHAGRTVPVALTRDGAVVATVETTLDSEGRGEAVFTVTPDKAGRVAWLVRVPDDADDAVPANNSLPVVVSVVRDRLRVLQVAGTPTWDVKFLRRFLKGDPSVDLVSFFILRTPEDEISAYDDRELSLIPFPYEQLFEGEISTFDVVVFQNFNFAPYFNRNGPKLLTNLRDFVVRDGHGFIMVGGDRSFSLGGYAESPLAEILPVGLPPSPGEADVAPFRPGLSDAGLRHPITRLVPDEAETAAWWERLHALDGTNVVGDAMPGATVLLSHPGRTTPSGAPMPVLAAREVGAGRTVALTVDASWRWSVSEAAAGAGNQAYLRLWKNALRWVVGDAATSRLAVEVARENYAPDEEIPLTVRARRADMSPAVNVEVAVDVVVEGSTTSIRGTTDATGTWTTPWTATQRGTHSVRAQATDGAQVLTASTMFTVTARDPELDDVTPDAAFLQALASSAAGRYVGVGEALDVLRDPAATRTVAERRDIDLARTPWMALLAAFALGAATWVRRRAGLA